MESDWAIWTKNLKNPCKEIPLKFGYPIELGMHEKEAELLIGYLELVDIPELAICVNRLREQLRMAKRHK